MASPLPRDVIPIIERCLRSYEDSKRPEILVFFNLPEPHTLARACKTFKKVWILNDDKGIDKYIGAVRKRYWHAVMPLDDCTAQTPREVSAAVINVLETKPNGQRAGFLKLCETIDAIRTKKKSLSDYIDAENAWYKTIGIHTNWKTISSESLRDLVKQPEPLCLVDVSDEEDHVVDDRIEQEVGMDKFSRAVFVWAPITTNKENKTPVAWALSKLSLREDRSLKNYCLYTTKTCYAIMHPPPAKPGTIVNYLGLHHSTTPILRSVADIKQSHQTVLFGDKTSRAIVVPKVKAKTKSKGKKKDKPKLRLPNEFGIIEDYTEEEQAEELKKFRGTITHAIIRSGGYVY